MDESHDVEVRIEQACFTASQRSSCVVLLTQPDCKQQGQYYNIAYRNLDPAGITRTLVLGAMREVMLQQPPLCIRDVDHVIPQKPSSFVPFP